MRKTVQKCHQNLLQKTKMCSANGVSIVDVKHEVHQSRRTMKKKKNFIKPQYEFQQIYEYFSLNRNSGIHCRQNAI